MLLFCLAVVAVLAGVAVGVYLGTLAFFTAREVFGLCATYEHRVLETR